MLTIRGSSPILGNCRDGCVWSGWSGFVTLVHGDVGESGSRPCKSSTRHLSYTHKRRNPRSSFYPVVMVVVAWLMPMDCS